MVKNNQYPPSQKNVEPKIVQQKIEKAQCQNCQECHEDLKELTDTNNLLTSVLEKLCIYIKDKAVFHLDDDSKNIISDFNAKAKDTSEHTIELLGVKAQLAELPLRMSGVVDDEMRKFKIKLYSNYFMLFVSSLCITGWYGSCSSYEGKITQLENEIAHRDSIEEFATWAFDYSGGRNGRLFHEYRKMKEYQETDELVHPWKKQERK